MSDGYTYLHIFTLGKTSVEACRNGEQCRYLKAGRCNFSHPQQPLTNQQQKRKQPQQQKRNQPHQQRIHQQPQQRKNQQPQPSSQQQEESRVLDHGWKTVQNRKRSSLLEQQREQRKNVLCRWGEGCNRLKSGLCPLKHSPLQNSIPHQSQSDRPKLWCKFQETCLNGLGCRFKHFQQGFPQRNPMENHF